MSELLSYEEYEDAVIADIIRQTGWTEQQARNVAGDLDDMRADGLSPSEAVNELFYAAQT
jgi:hypothetical protein